jgi:hypothetical protein
MKLQQFVTIALACLLITGCAVLGKKRVSDEQINADLEGKNIEFNGGKDPWLFHKSKERCFQVMEGDVKTADGITSVPVVVSSFRTPDSYDPFPFYSSIYGKVIMRYKEQDGKPVLDGIDPVDGVYKSFEDKGTLKLFLDEHVNVCKGFRQSVL